MSARIESSQVHARNRFEGVTTRKCSECTTSWTKHERAARWYVRCTLDGCRSGGARRHVSDVPEGDVRPVYPNGWHRPQLTLRREEPNDENSRRLRDHPGG